MNKNKQDDRDYLKKLCKALDVSERRLKQDVYQYWVIVGTRGYISTEGDFWYLYADTESIRKWNLTKKQLSFMEVHQDGDDEGILKCGRMPFRDEAREVRKVIGVRPTTKLTEAQRASLISRLSKRNKEGVSGSRIDLNDMGGT